jgi:hypothetical protein
MSTTRDQRDHKTLYIPVRRGLYSRALDPSGSSS